MNVPAYFLAAQVSQYELVYVWRQATPEAKVIIFTLLIFSIMAWSVMGSKAVQMRRAKKLNQLFNTEFRRQNNVLAIYDRRIQVEGWQLPFEPVPFIRHGEADGLEFDRTEF